MSGEEEVCRAFRNNGSCRFGDDCKFAHTEGEPIAPPDGPRVREECFNFRDSGECTHGDRCRFTHGGDDNRHSGNIGDEICRNYARGRCNLGDECRRKHEGPVKEAAAPRTRAKGVCFAFRDEGECERGDDCQFSHTSGGEGGGSAPRSRKRAPREPREPRARNGAGVCYAFRDDGNCERGDECRFSHGDEQKEAPSSSGRSRGECFDFRDGTCDRGDECRFAHGDSDSAPRARKPRAQGECYDFMDGNCDRGDDCRFSHVIEAGAEAKPRRAPRELKKIDEICNNFKAGRCRLGDRCSRIHE